MNLVLALDFWMPEETKDKRWHSVVAERRDGTSVHVTEVENGLKCNCLCTDCHQPVVAHQGNINAKHFQHYRKTNCNPSPESDLHRFAKEILSEKPYLYLPEGTAKVGSKSTNLFMGGRCKFVEAKIEAAIGNVTPDLILTKADGKRLHVEIYVRHRCDDEKIAKLKTRNLDTIEIDLSDIRWDDDRSSWIEPIIRTAPRVWLHNTRVVEHEHRTNLELQKKKAIIVRALTLSLDVAQVPDASLLADRATIEKLRRDHLVDHEIIGDHCFSVDREFWQSRLVRRYFLGSDARKQEKFTTKDALITVQDYIVAGLGGFIEKDVAAEVRLELIHFKLPFKIVEEYLSWLNKKVHYANRLDGYTWQPSLTAVSALEDDEKRQKWRAECSVWLDEILEKVPAAEIAGFDRDSWLGMHSWVFLGQNWGWKEVDWNNLQLRMSEIRAMVLTNKRYSYELDLLGLPLEREYERRNANHVTTEPKSLASI